LETGSDVRVVNIVSTGKLASELDLLRVNSALEGSVFVPEQFPAVRYRMVERSVSFLIFRSGKIVCTGAKDEPSIHTSVEALMVLLRGSGLKLSDSFEMTVQNIVAVGRVRSALNLIQLAITLNLDSVEYEPEQFPGMVYRVPDIGVVFLIFASGSIVITGAKNLDTVDEAYEMLTRQLEELGLLT
jgi:transcription initiation factor TFIID TATA-box-binding protein